MVSVIPRKKVLILRHSEVYGRVNFEAMNGRKWHEKISLIQNPAPANTMFSSETDLKLISKSLLLFFVPRNSNSELFSLPWTGSEQNSKFLPLFLFQGMEFGVVFSSAE
jgi:hypothetical protein